jgi:hypothetical protein
VILSIFKGSDIFCIFAGHVPEQNIIDIRSRKVIEFGSGLVGIHNNNNNHNGSTNNNNNSSSSSSSTAAASTITMTPLHSNLGHRHIPGQQQQQQEESGVIDNSNSSNSNPMVVIERDEEDDDGYLDFAEIYNK